MAEIASSASGPTARTRMRDSLGAASINTPMMLLPLTSMPSLEIRISEANRLARWTNWAAARACSPSRFRISNSRSTTGAPVFMFPSGIPSPHLEGSLQENQRTDDQQKQQDFRRRHRLPEQHRQQVNREDRYQEESPRRRSPSEQDGGPASRRPRPGPSEDRRNDFAVHRPGGEPRPLQVLHRAFLPRHPRGESMEADREVRQVVKEQQRGDAQEGVDEGEDRAR